MSPLTFAWIAGYVTGLLTALVIMALIERSRRRHQPPKGLSTSFDVRGANDSEMDAINATIRREWNTREEDEAWKHL